MTIKTTLAYDFFFIIFYRNITVIFYVCWIQMVVYDSFYSLLSFWSDSLIPVLF